MHTITIDLGERSYPIYLGSNILGRLPELYHSSALPSRLVIVTDTNLATSHLKNFSSSFRHHGIETITIVIPPGERQKSLDRAGKLYEALLKNQITRSDALIAFGGGVIGDLAGYVAATYRRGIAFIHVPTTLLAQTESAIGGKSGINLSSAKNVIGAFYQPKFVFSDVHLLSTLPRREIICGLGEVVKYGYLDERMFRLLDRHLEDVLGKKLDIMMDIILRCNKMKAVMISRDERETNTTGGRMVLNLGHTIGQALEVLSNYRLRHGEAVLIGLRWELMIAEEAQFISANDAGRIKALLDRIGFHPRLPFLRSEMLVRKLFQPKNKPRFVLPRTIGEVVVTSEIGESLARSVFKRVLLR